MRLPIVHAAPRFACRPPTRQPSRPSTRSWPSNAPSITPLTMRSCPMGLTETASNQPTVDYRGVWFTADRVALLDGDHEVVTIPLDNIRALTLRRGRST